MTLAVGTSCPPSITRWAILPALITGLSVQTKNSLIKYPNFLASSRKINLSGAENTVSKQRLLFSFKQVSRFSAASLTALSTASGEFQSPKTSLAILSGLIYSHPSIHCLQQAFAYFRLHIRFREKASCSSIFPVTDVFPEPFGPAIIISLGFIFFKFSFSK